MTTDTIKLWRVTALFFFLNGAFYGTWAARIPAIRDQYSLGEAELGLVLLSMAVGSLSAMAVIARVVARRGNLFVARIAFFFLLPIFPLIGLTSNVAVLVVVFFGIGISIGSMDVAMNGIGAELEEAMDRSILSRLHGLWSVGGGVGAGLGALAASLELSILLHFLIILTGAVTLFLAFDRAKATPPSSTDTATAMWPTRRLLVIGGFAFIAFMFEGVVFDWGALYLIDIYGTTAAEAPLGLIAFSTAMILMRMTGDQLVDRLGAFNVAALSVLTIVIGATVTVTAPVAEYVFLGFFICGLGFANLAPLTFSAAGKSRTIPRENAIATIGIMGYGSLLAGPPLMGFVAEISSLTTCFVLMGIATLCLAPFTKVFRQMES